MFMVVRVFKIEIIGKIKFLQLLTHTHRTQRM